MKYEIIPDPASILVVMEGRFTFLDARVFLKMMHMLCENKEWGIIRFDVSKLEMMDSMGLDLMMKAHDTAKKQRRHLVFEGAQGQVMERLMEAAQHNALNFTNMAA